MSLFLSLALFFACLEALALWKNWSRLEYLAKPMVMIALFLGLWTSTGLKGSTLWFGLGILFSLVGDVFLMVSASGLFFAGLLSFFLVHIFYLIGFNSPAPALSAWGFLLAIMISLGGVRVMRRIVASFVDRKQARLRTAILLYGVVISFMLLSAMLKLTDLSWNAGSALLVSAGAFLFYFSDILLAWRKFVAPFRNARLYNMLAYQLGQILLIAGVILQFNR